MGAIRTRNLRARRNRRRALDRAIWAEFLDFIGAAEVTLVAIHGLSGHLQDVADAINEMYHAAIKDPIR